MLIYIGFDDTDSTESAIGTGKLARWLNTELPDGCRCKGVIRQQLLVCPEIPYTSHNSSACFLAEIADPALMDIVIEKAIHHISKYAVAGSDPGLCVVAETDPCMVDLTEFGHCCTQTENPRQKPVASRISPSFRTRRPETA